MTVIEQIIDDKTAKASRNSIRILEIRIISTQVMTHNSRMTHDKWFMSLPEFNRKKEKKLWKFQSNWSELSKIPVTRMKLLAYWLLPSLKHIHTKRMYPRTPLHIKIVNKFYDLLVDLQTQFHISTQPFKFIQVVNIYITLLLSL